MENNVNVLDYIEKIAASNLDDQAKAYFKVQSMQDAINSRNEVQKVLKSRIKASKEGGIKGFFAKRSIAPLQKDLQSFNDMIAYGQKNKIK